MRLVLLEELEEEDHVGLLRLEEQTAEVMDQQFAELEEPTPPSMRQRREEGLS